MVWSLEKSAKRSRKWRKQLYTAIESLLVGFISAVAGIEDQVSLAPDTADGKICFCHPI